MCPCRSRSRATARPPGLRRRGRRRPAGPGGASGISIRRGRRRPGRTRPGRPRGSRRRRRFRDHRT
ncbi:MAG TPA: hypothetical protein EYM46_01155 [Acidimicrobiia bacterium]|nr:hypothetical protein [Acidimicrobiia bacterium]HIM85060.1 hypothetical protein [Acidimicrobiia bacterium]